MPIWGGNLTNPVSNGEYSSPFIRDQSSNLNRPQNDDELFSGRLNVQEGNEKLDYRMINPLTTAMGDSTEKASRSNNMLGYLLTENF